MGFLVPEKSISPASNAKGTRICKPYNINCLNIIFIEISRRGKKRYKPKIPGCFRPSRQHPDLKAFGKVLCDITTSDSLCNQITAYHTELSSATLFSKHHNSHTQQNSSERTWIRSKKRIRHDLSTKFYILVLHGNRTRERGKKRTRRCPTFHKHT